MDLQTEEIWVTEDNIRRKLEGAELIAFLEHRAELKRQEEKIKAEEEEAQAKRSAALAKLEALGLNEDDLKALGL